ncbi:MAG: Trm112 family protein [Chloroflexota bacterium]
MNDRENPGGDRPVSEELLRLLVCPIAHSDLRVEGTDLICTRCGRRYPVEDGIPNMLVEV